MKVFKICEKYFVLLCTSVHEKYKLETVYFADIKIVERLYGKIARSAANKIVSLRHARKF